MKFLLVPFIIIAMCVSFAAALVGMLFLTGTVQTPQELRDLFQTAADTTRLADELTLREDKLESVFEQAAEFKQRYEEDLRQAGQLRDSLLVEQVKNGARKDSLLRWEKDLGRLSDSTFQVRQEENLKDLITLYNKIKPAKAAEILQQKGELSDTSVARLIKKLQPSQMAKIMGYMKPEYAAHLTRIIQEL